ncbi:mus81 structure-specific endonuclease subunit isoform X2 [Oratosquilla oratoria]|uniref:mus81 structure-specific endonuclease subunit isoform X2 n=1 Tax=Oratosquilla oratoria TaxID=337810 RepID=UPI003F768A76
MERKRPSKDTKKMWRIKRTYKHPNPLFEKWLLEWKEEAAQRQSNMKYNFQRALKSLRQFPLPLESGKDCKILAHFGDKICSMLDKKLEKYKEDNGPIVWEDHIQVVENRYKKTTKSKSSQQNAGGKSGSQSGTESSRSRVSAEDSNTDESQAKGRKKQNRPYVPAVRSGAYALLVALYQGTEDDSLEFMTKAQLIEAAEPLADCSFTHSEGTYYTAWSSMSTLVSKGLVTKESNPAKFRLTEEGKELAERLLGVEVNSESVPTSAPSNPSSSSTLSSSSSLWQRKRSDSPEEVVLVSSRSNSPFDLTEKKPTVNRSPSSHDLSPPRRFSPSRPSSSVGLSPVHSPVQPEVESPPWDPPSPLCLSPWNSPSPCKPRMPSSPQCFTLDSNSPPHSRSPSPLPPPSPLSPSSPTSPLLPLIHSPLRFDSSPPPQCDTEPQKSSPLRNPPSCDEGSPTEATKGSKFVFSYVDGRDIETPLKDKALASVEDDGFLGFLIKCRLTDLERSGVEYHADYTRSAPIGYVYAYLADSYAPEMCPGLHTPHKTKESQNSPNQNGFTLDKQKKLPNLKRKMESPETDIKTSVQSISKKKSGQMNSDVFSKDVNKLEDLVPSKFKRKMESPEMDIKTSVQSIGKNKSSLMNGDIFSKGVSKLETLVSESIRKDGQALSKTKSDMVPEPVKAKSQELTKPKFALSPGQYEVILCVDNAETTGGFAGHKKGTKDIIITELKKNGVNFDVRKLHIGDFLWVCREKVAPVPGRLQAPKAKELVLPYIIERKRMDDLASSIRDGRFKEQKFRLKQTGLSCPIYLVEAYGTQNSSLPESTCEQAIVNTQIVDGFAVKCTVDQRESAAYLTIMTRYLQSRYQNKRLECYAHSDLTEDMKRCTTKLVSFEELNSSSVKNRQLTVREMFAKHLMQLHGLSAVKAKVIVDEYGTPAALQKALQSCSENNREQILADLKCTKTNRKIGQVVSSTVCKLYSMRTVQ